MALRANNQLMLLEIEAAEGVGETPAVGSGTTPVNEVAIERTFPAGDPEVEEANEATGSLDQGRPSLGPHPLTLPLNARLRGNVTAGSAAEMTVPLRTGGLLESLVAALGPADATSGTTTTCVVDRSVDTDFPASSGIASGMIGRWVTLSGNPATAVTVQITDYQVSGSNVTLTFDRTFGSALSATTDLQVLAGALYRPHSGTIPSCTAWHYLDGNLWKYIGCRTELNLTFASSKSPRMAATLHAMFSDHISAAMVVPAFPNLSYGLWRNGACFLDGMAAGVGIASLALNLGNALEHPPNPNTAEGIEAALIGRRQITATLDPNTQLVSVKEWFKAKARTQTPIKVCLQTDLAGAAGNRIGLVIPQLLLRNALPGERGVIAADQMAGWALGVDSAFVLSFA
jgi:hypothetical protein